mmetsp:Transcript_13860/g.38090  ORF Transcript_13860/g.38090 Transcript_13860/m.38090 type:complete len:88 (+) Transcript_13860:367-630(+)
MAILTIMLTMIIHYGATLGETIVGGPCRAKRRGSRLQVREIVRQISEVSDAEISQDDIISTLRRMDADGIVQFKERSQTIFIRPTIM